MSVDSKYATLLPFKATIIEFNAIFSSKENTLSVYVHWPFCKSKCPYCDFNSHVAQNIDNDAYINAYLKEIEYYASKLGKGTEITTIFFGGGTPSLAPPHFFEKVISSLAQHFKMASDVEITMEANPTSVEAEKFKEFKQAGINRVSMGIQSFDDANLKFLGREHSAHEAQKAIEIAAGTFDRYSFDLIYTLPGQSVQAWEKELNRAISLGSRHLSLYQLTIEKGTPFYSQHRKNVFEMPDDELSAEMFECTNNIMDTLGLPPYEISNYAREGQECRHNLAYWQYRNFIGIGPGAHGRYQADGKRSATMKIHSPTNWLKAVDEKGLGLQSSTDINDSQAFEEKIIMGLRMYKPLEIDTGKLKNLEHLKAHGLLNYTQNKVMVTDKGRLLLNKIISEIL